MVLPEATLPPAADIRDVIAAAAPHLSFNDLKCARVDPAVARDVLTLDECQVRQLLENRAPFFGAVRSSVFGFWLRPCDRSVLIAHTKSGCFTADRTSPKRAKCTIMVRDRPWFCRGHNADTFLGFFFLVEHGSPEFNAFLGTIGRKVKLKGFSGYRGGLDVQGKIAFFFFPKHLSTDDCGLKVAFFRFVLVCLPFSPFRRRHWDRVGVCHAERPRDYVTCLHLVAVHTQ